MPVYADDLQVCIDKLLAADLDLDVEVLCEIAIVSYLKARAGRRDAAPSTTTSMEATRVELVLDQQLLAQFIELVAVGRVALDAIGSEGVRLLLQMYPLGQARGSSLAELLDLANRSRTGRETHMEVAIRPGEKYPVDVTLVGPPNTQRRPAPQRAG